MNIVIGLIGPADTVELVQEVGREWEAEGRLKLVPFVYEDVDTLAESIRPNDRGIDVWLFTGRIAYEIGRKHVPEGKALMIRSSGSALMKTLFEVMRTSGLPRSFSVDSLNEAEVSETLHELRLADSCAPEVYPTTGYVPSAELVQFHAALHMEGRVSLCITHRGSVYQELLRRGIPAFRIIPTVMSVRETLRLASQLGKTEHFRQSQIASLLLEVRSASEEEAGTYEAYRLNLKLQELLLQFAEHVYGALIPAGNAAYCIFSTRGAIEQSLEFPPSLLFEKIRLLSKGTVHLGIGYGLTAFGAERNAAMAIARTKKNEKGGLSVIDETGAVQEMTASSEPLSFQYLSSDLAVIEQLKTAGVSPATYSRIVSVQSGTGKQAVSAADLAAWLDMTPRNANRLLSDLARCGLARVVGEEAPAPKGRPRKLFRIGPDPEQAEQMTD